MGEQSQAGAGEDEPERGGPGEAADDPEEEEEASSAPPGQLWPTRPLIDPVVFRITAALPPPEASGPDPETG